MAIKIQLGEKRKFDYPSSIQEVDKLSGEQFELFIFNYLKDYQGYEGEMTEKNDFGVDLIMWKKRDDNNRFGIQCKRYGPKTILGENELVKMQKGVTRYNLANPETRKPNLILFTSAEKVQISGRGLAYIENNDIQTYYRDDIIEILKDLDERLDRGVNLANYSNIAFETGKNKNESFKENTKFVDMLKKERMNISKYNKISPVYLVYNDKTIEDIIVKKPTTLEQLLEVKGFDKAKIDLFGEYLINRIRTFLNLDTINSKDVRVKEINKDEFKLFLKETRKKIASFNKIEKLYNVFNNNTLDAIVERLPRTNEELLQISGIGAAKIELWGSYLLKEIDKYLDK